MKRFLAVFLAFCMLPSWVCYAEETFENPISLCYDGDAYAVYSTGGTIIATNNTVLHAARQYFIYDLANGAAPASITIDGKVVAKQTK